MHGCITLTQWQDDYIDSLLRSKGALFALMAADIATVLLFAWTSGQLNQHTTIHALTAMMVLFG